MAGGPPKTRVETVLDDYHGTKVADSYRWLEDTEAPEVRRWVAAQNADARSFLDRAPNRPALRRRLRQLLEIGVVGTPRARGGYYFHLRREGKQDQLVLYVRRGPRGADRPLVDPHRLSKESVVAIDWWRPSEDGALLAYGTSFGGSEKSTLRVLDVRTGRHLPDSIPHTRYSSLAWLPDDSAFYYTRYPAPGTVPKGEENYNNHLYFHRLGGRWEEDPKVFGEGRHPQEIYDAELSSDARYLRVTSYTGWSRSDLYIQDRSRDEGEFLPIVEGRDALFTGEIVGDTLYLLTNLDAPRYRLVAVDLERPEERHWRTLITEGTAVLNQAAYAGGRLVALTTEDVSSHLSVHDLRGRKVREVKLPTLGTVEAVSARHDSPEAFFAFYSFAVPPTAYRLDVRTGRAAVWKRVRAKPLPKVVVRQVFYQSKDGTKVPMFLVHRAGLKRNGRNPTVLTGYGGFNISLTPQWVAGRYCWVERGGLLAVANLRGGAEYGEAWHRAGMLGNKQNVFDDFLAAAQYLVRERYTSPSRLACLGGSNGGLLVGAAITQRPDLFRAAVAAVPLFDMLRYHHYQIAKLWIPEYGSSEDAEEFRWLHGYSPYHRVKEGTAYPATLITTAEGDSRVDPMHARKMAARLQAATSSGLPVLLRTDMKAGHGVGKPVTKVLEESVDVYGFLLGQVD